MNFSSFSLPICLFIVLAGIGCSTVTSESEAQTEAEATDLQTGSALTVKQTIFGLGGVFAETVSGNDLAEYQVSISSFVPESAVSFSWLSQAKQETEESVVARAAYEAAEHPIGDTTAKPEPVYETITKSGSCASTGLDDAVNVLLPAYWSEDGQALEDNSLIWLSKKQYDDLVNTKETTLSLGLFDAKLADLVSMTDAVRNAINTLQQKAEQASEGEDIYKLTADDDWKSFSLTIDGEEKTVRTLEASNWFGSYVILANPDNPLILKATLNPFALGSFDLSSPLFSFLGYEVTKIELK